MRGSCNQNISYEKSISNEGKIEKIISYKQNKITGELGKLKEKI